MDPKPPIAADCLTIHLVANRQPLPRLGQFLNSQPLLIKLVHDVVAEIEPDRVSGFER